MTDKTHRRLLYLYKCIQQEQKRSQLAITSGLMKCQQIDAEAIEALEQEGITPTIFYQCRTDVTTRADRIAAAKYYSQFLDNISIYHMHHTADGLYIIPVKAETHQNIKHIGGSYLIHRQQYNKLLKEYQAQTQTQTQNLEDFDIDKLFDI